MTTYVQARDEAVALIHGHFQTAHPTVPVFWENTTSVDLDTVGNAFLRVEVDFDDAAQLTMDVDPWHRIYGEMYLTIFYKEGTGTRQWLALLDTLTNLAKFRFSTKVKFWTPTPGKKGGKNGWQFQELRVPFYFDSWE